MTNDPFEDRLARALARSPAAEAASRLHARVTAIMTVSRSTPVSKPASHPYRWVAATVAVASLLLLGIGFAMWWPGRPGLPRAGSAMVSQQPVHVLQVSWPRSYADIADLAADADLIVGGTISAIESEPTATIAQTRATIAVERVLRGTARDTIVVNQTGGRTEVGTWVVDGDRLMEEGEHALLFLRDIGTRPDGTKRYVTLGGPQGRFDVAADGTITPVSDLRVDVLDATTVDEVGARAQALDAEAEGACVLQLRSIPNLVVRSGAPAVADAAVMSVRRITEYMRRVDLPPATWYLEPPESIVACLVDGDLQTGRGELAERVLVLIVGDRAEVAKWADERAALPAFDGS